MNNKINKLENKEKFTTEQSNTSITESIKNLGIIAKNLIDNNGTYIFPADVNITGRLNLLPAGTIVMWTQATIPDGWVPCDGTRGTPDLRGRFVLGQGKGSGLTNRTLNQRSGAETHTLAGSEMPDHKHLSGYYRIWDSLGADSGDSTAHGAWGSVVHNNNSTLDNNNHSNDDGRSNNFNRKIDGKGRCDPLARATICEHKVAQDYSQPRGGGRAHNNMPPYHVLIYIMKVYD